MSPDLSVYGDLKYNHTTGEIAAKGISIAQVLNGPYVGYHHTLGVAMASAPKMLAVLKRAIELYGKPGGPWNVPNDPGSWLADAKEAVAWSEVQWTKEMPVQASVPDLLGALNRIAMEAQSLAAECPPAPHACPACEILHVANEALAKAEGTP